MVSQKPRKLFLAIATVFWPLLVVVSGSTLWQALVAPRAGDTIASRASYAIAGFLLGVLTFDALVTGPRHMPKWFLLLCGTLYAVWGVWLLLDTYYRLVTVGPPAEAYTVAVLMLLWSGYLFVVSVRWLFR